MVRLQQDTLATQALCGVSENCEGWGSSTLKDSYMYIQAQIYKLDPRCFDEVGDEDDADYGDYQCSFQQKNPDAP